MKAERVRVEFTQSRANVFKVPAKQWRQWSVPARQVFNEVYSSMSGSQWVFNHPEQPAMSKSHWKTVCWNSAWTASDALMHALPNRPE
jgi:hypothetical protein